MYFLAQMFLLSLIVLPTVWPLLLFTNTSSVWLRSLACCLGWGSQDPAHCFFLYVAAKELVITDWIDWYCKVSSQSVGVGLEVWE